MKRLWAPVLSVAMFFAVVACGSSDEPSKKADESSTTTKQDEQTDSADSTDSASKAELDAFTDEVERQVKKQVGTMNGVYSEIRVDPVYPSGIEYVYLYAKPVDAQAAARELAKSTAVLKASFDTQIAPELEAKGFSDPSATFTYRNPDGSKIWSRTFTKS